VASKKRAIERTLRVLFIASEADPFIKVGGLADVAGSLPPALLSLSPQDINGWTIDVRLVLPFHSAIRSKLKQFTPVGQFVLPRLGVPIEGQIFETNSAVINSANPSIHPLKVYLVDGPPFRQGPQTVYSGDAQVDGERYTFFSLAVLELARKLNWSPDILHANDWHTALSVYAIQLERLAGVGKANAISQSRSDSFFADTRSILTIHNLSFMGAGSEQSLQAYSLPASQDPRLPPWARQMPLPLGLLTADSLVAVSPAYAEDILKPGYGCDLQDFLQTRSQVLTGILNGLDTSSWNPSTDPHLAANFDSNHLEDRLLNRQTLLQEVGLSDDLKIPLIISVGRIDQQKGIDLLLQSLRQVLDLPWQVILLGTGDHVLESSYRKLSEDYPDRVRVFLRFDDALSRRMYAGADLLAMPSRYEPCGLAQMIAMRYGCIPLAHATGGLKDTIIDDPQLGTGFLFEEAQIQPLEATLRRALSLYQDRTLWQSMQKRAMEKDFSWQRSALEYARIYQKLVNNG